MFIKRTSRQVGGKTYVNHLLVESIATPGGPRHRTICSLGSLAPAPEAQWRGLAQKLSSALGGQTTFLPEPAVAAIAARARPPRGRPRPAAAVGADVVAVHTHQVTTEDPQEAGPVHVGHHMWRALELDRILEAAGLAARARRLTELMTLNRLVHPASEHAMPDWIRRTALADISAPTSTRSATRHSIAIWTGCIPSALRLSGPWPRASARSSTSTTRSISTT